jgi:hypothetical protein
VISPQWTGLTLELRTRLKRLLETDRSFGRIPRSVDPERANFAFYSADAPGSGVEVLFSQYEAFALLNGLRLMRHAWPQGFAVSLLRRMRPELEKVHARILRQDPKELFDADTIRRKPRDDMQFNISEPVLLTIVSKADAAPTANLSHWLRITCQFFTC